MSDSLRISAALLAVLAVAGFVAIRDRVCHALRVACAALVITLAGLFYNSGFAASGGALGVLLSCVTALLRPVSPRQRPHQPGARRETLR